MKVVLAFPDEESTERQTDLDVCPRIGELVFIEGQAGHRVKDVEHQYREHEGHLYHLFAIVILEDAE